MRTKMYDVNATFDEEPTYVQTDEEAGYWTNEFNEELEGWFDESDPDYVLVAQFEDGLVEALQSDVELASCYQTYADARRRLSERAKGRGFWNPSGKGASKNKNHFGKNNSKGYGKPRKSLSQRILESNCRKCGQRGHWKAECPLNQPSAGSSSTSTKEQSFAGTVEPLDYTEEESDMILRDDQVLQLTNPQPKSSPCNQQVINVCYGDQTRISSGYHPVSDRAMTRFVTHLRHHLNPQPTKIVTEVSVNHPCQEPASTADALFASSGPYGIVDLGASQTVIGRSQVDELLSHLHDSIRSAVQTVPCSTVFRFGNNSTVQCREALLIPMAKWNIRICIVDSKTPFLISNNVFRTLGACIDTEKNSVTFRQLNITMPLTLSGKRLFLLDFCELVHLGNHSWETPDRPRETMMVTDLPCRSSVSSAVLSSSQSFIITPGSQVPTGSSDSCQTSKPDSAPTGSSESIRDLDRETDCTHGVSFDRCRNHLDSQPCRPTGQDSPEPGSSRVHGLDPPGTGGVEDHVRRNQGESIIPQSAGDRPQVCQVVRSPVPGSERAEPSALPALHQDVCGAPREDHLQDQSCEEAASPGQEQSGQCSSRSGSDRFERRQRRVTFCDPREQHAAGRDAHPSEPHDQPGEQHDGHRPTAPATDPSSEWNVSSVGTMSTELQTLLCDDFGCHEVLEDSSNIIDSGYFIDIILDQVDRGNWVYEEMWRYWKAKQNLTSIQQVQHHFSKCLCDLFEVYCSSESQLTAQAQKLGMRAVRFGLRQGDLATFAGRCQLYDALWKYRPEHIWASPRCSPWSGWSHLNAMKSRELAQTIQQERKSENVHLLVCDALLRVQVWRGPRFHFHLEQPQGSDLVYQDEMSNIVTHTLKVLCDMCTAGNLKHPRTGNYLKKRTQVLTTSKIVWRMLEQHQCLGQHLHDPIEGSFKPTGHPRVAVSKYTELYTATFGRRLCRAFQCSQQVREAHIDARTEPILGPTAEESAPKRRRLTGKWDPQYLFKEPSQEPRTEQQEVSRQQQLHAILHKVDQVTPRVGKHIISEGPLCDMIRALYPDHDVKVIESCRGINRKRTCPINNQTEECPLRRAFGRRRADLEVFEDSSWENWAQLSRRQQQSACTASKLLVTVFASQKRNNTEPVRSNIEPIRDPELRHDRPSDPMDEPALKRVRFDSNPEDEPRLPSDPPNGSQSTNMPGSQVTTHGPMFRGLEPKIQALISQYTCTAASSPPGGMVGYHCTELPRFCVSHLS